MKKQEATAINMAKFIKAQLLILLEKLNELDLDERANECEQLHDLEPLTKPS
ncbi:Rop family plasmid primer RNA-binding protein [Edwardsiella ictaluri]|uniref:Rop family plasmid primer RNA-binding protein n=1 Tax=Edwardsiella ictaluri TaxID=67780 RepID=UPI0036D43516